MFVNPIKISKTFGVREDSIVADLGAGTGFYTIALSYLTPKGKVYAIEIQKDFLKKISNKAKAENLLNVECMVGDVEKKGGTKLKDKILDVAVASNLLSQIADKESFFEEVKRILKPEGKFVLIDWSHRSPLISKNHKIIPKEKALEMLDKKGFVWHQDIDAGEHHYGIILKNK